MPPLLYPFFAAGGLTRVYCHHYKWGELLGAEGMRSLCTTTNAPLQPLKPGSPFPGVVRQPTLSDSSHAIWRHTIFALKILAFFCSPVVTEWLWAFRSLWLLVGESIFLLPGGSRGDKHPQTPEKRFCLTRGNVMVRSGTAHPKVLKTC